MSNLNQDITRFYQAWHAYEKSLGDRGGLVIDFDMAPRLGEDVQPYSDRMKAFAALQTLRDRAEGAENTLANPAYMRTKLLGSDTYLRALMGEKLSFVTYVERAMGYTPARVDEAFLASERADLTEAFDQLDIPFDETGRKRLGRRIGRSNMKEFGADLRREASKFVGRIREKIPSAEEPEYSIKATVQDAYWSNWIDGSVEQGVLLQVNTHPRISFNKFSHIALAAHEIAGHAMHVSCTRRSAASPTAAVDPCALNLTVHGCDAYHMEGIAQTMLSLLTEPAELPPELPLLERYRSYVGDVKNNAQFDVEAGRPIDEVCDATLEACPLTQPLSIRSSLRDRSLSPLFRSYIHVYAPCRRAFHRVLDQSPEKRDAFLRATICHIYTPSQIDELLEGRSPTLT